MRRKWFMAVAGIVLVGLIVGGTALVVSRTWLRPKTITAYFTTATAIYPGDDVRVAGVKVGNIAAIQPDGTQARVTLHVDRDVPIARDARAVVVAQNLVAARYVQLTSSHASNSPMPDGAVIPIERTAVPVEWDEVKAQLMRLATDLGPTSQVSTPSLSRFIDSAANSLEGNGDKLRQTLGQLSGVARILANGSGNIVDIIRNLQTFVSALRDSNAQIVQFQDRFATLTSVLDESKSDLDAALTNLSVAVGEVQRFVAGTRDKASEQVQRLADATQNIVDHRSDLENVLHVAPNAFSNFYNIYDPDTGMSNGLFVVTQLSNPVQSICMMIESIENVTAAKSGKECAEYLGPGLRFLNFNYLPIPQNPMITKSADPENVIYTDPALIPCHPHMEACTGGLNGTTPTPPEIPPAISAYSGLHNDSATGGPGDAGAQQLPPTPHIDSAPPGQPFPTPTIGPGAPLPAERPQP